MRKVQRRKLKIQKINDKGALFALPLLIMILAGIFFILKKTLRHAVRSTREPQSYIASAPAQPSQVSRVVPKKTTRPSMAHQLSKAQIQVRNRSQVSISPANKKLPRLNYKKSNKAKTLKMAVIYPSAPLGYLESEDFSGVQSDVSHEQQEFDYRQRQKNEFLKYKVGLNDYQINELNEKIRYYRVAMKKAEGWAQPESSSRYKDEINNKQEQWMIQRLGPDNYMEFLNIGH